MSYSVNELVEEYIEELRDEGKRWREIASQVKRLLRDFGDRDPESLTTRDLEDYRKKRREEKTVYGGPYKHSSINRELQYLQAALRRAEKLELISKLPRFRKVPERNRRTDWCRKEDLEKIVEHLRAHQQHGEVYADIVTFFFNSGWRKREVLDLRWSEIDWEQGLICLPPERTKNRKGRVFPIAGAVEEVLSRRWAKRNGPWVFHRDGKAVRDFRRAWLSARRDVGRPDLKLHGFRRSFATYAMLAGTPDSVIMELAGWTTRSVFERYRIVSQDMLRAAIDRQRDYFKKNTGTNHGNNEDTEAPDTAEGNGDGLPKGE